MATNRNACFLWGSVVILLLITFATSQAQPPQLPVLWQRTLTPGTDFPVQSQTVGQSVSHPTPDGGIIVVFQTNWPALVKLDRTGRTAWTKEFSGERTVFTIIDTPEDDLLVIGTKQATPDTKTLFGSIIGSNGATKAYHVLFDAGVQYSPFSGITTSDGGVLLGVKKFPAGTPEPPVGFANEVVKLTPNGEREWQRNYDLGELIGLNKVADNQLQLVFRGSNDTGVTLLINNAGTVLEQRSGYPGTSRFIPSADGGYFEVIFNLPSFVQSAVNKYNRNFNRVAQVIISPSIPALGYSLTPTPDGGALYTYATNNPPTDSYRTTKLNAALSMESLGENIPIYLSAPDGSFFTVTQTRQSSGGLVNVTINKQASGGLLLAGTNYNCGSGRLTVQTQFVPSFRLDANASEPIQHRIAGLRDWGADPTFTVPSWQRNGTTFTLEARQGQQYVSTRFTTNTCESNLFALVEPAFDCASGTLTLRTVNADASAEFRVVGLRDWGRSPLFNVPPWQRNGTTFTLEGRLASGVYASRTFSTACSPSTPDPQARVSVEPLSNELPFRQIQMRAYPNPTVGDATIEITGGANQRLQLRVSNLLGQVMFSQPLDVHTEHHRQAISFNSLPAGLYLVQVVTTNQRATVFTLLRQ